MLSRAVERRMDALVEQVEHARRQNEALIEKLIEKEAYIKARLAEVSAQRNDARLIEELRHQLAIERNFSLKILKELKPLKDREARRQAEIRRRERTKMRVEEDKRKRRANQGDNVVAIDPDRPF
jgi:restriction endonuclease